MTDTDTTTTTRDGNWGRWGADDERGTLNLITPDAVLAATQVCRTGKVYSLSLPIQREGVPIFDYRGAPQRLTLTSRATTTCTTAYGAAPGVGANEDVLVIASHSITHMDALVARVRRRQDLQRLPAERRSPARRARRTATSTPTGTFAGRGVLLDLPAPPGRRLARARPRDHAAPTSRRAARRRASRCAPATSSSCAPGGSTSSPTGEASAFAQPGLGDDAVSFVDDHEIAVVGADNAAIECIPFDGNVFLGVHIELLVKRGVTLLEHLKLSELAADGCHEFFLSVGALPVTGAAGSPINPVAIG